ncbi:MAG TPA: hypothetical protein DCK93_16480 [Blastocatellia bacterium]|nr:hypothetical protein [Blastocatellia bacterium]
MVEKSAVIASTSPFCEAAINFFTVAVGLKIKVQPARNSKAIKKQQRLCFIHPSVNEPKLPVVCNATVGCAASYNLR